MLLLFWQCSGVCNLTRLPNYVLHFPSIFLSEVEEHKYEVQIPRVHLHLCNYDDAAEQ